MYNEENSATPMRSITDLVICRGNLVFSAVRGWLEVTDIRGCRSSKNRRRLVVTKRRGALSQLLRDMETRQIVTLADRKPRWDAIKITMPAGENPEGKCRVSLALLGIAILARTEENDA